MKSHKNQKRPLNDFPKNDPHLGGHGFVTHLDNGLLEYFKNEFQCQSLIDIGCGPGGMVELSQNLGYISEGIDGDYSLIRNNNINVMIHDYTSGPFHHTKKYDLGYSCEFVEHVDIEFVPNFMESFNKCKHVVMTYSPTGTPGYHHVNCNTKEYWIETFKRFGLIFDDAVTTQIKKVSTMKRNFIRDNGLYFKNESNNY